MSRSITSRLLGKFVARAGSMLSRAAGASSQSLKSHIKDLYYRSHSIDNFDMDANGESRLLKALPTPAPSSVVLDVGANVGQWSIAAAKTMPDVFIHLFEPSAITANVLLTNTAMAGLEGRVVVNQLGLSDKIGSVIFYENDNDSTLANAFNWHRDQPSRKTEVRMVTGEQYCRDHGIERLFFVKVDVEGAELDVLRGLVPLFRQGLILFTQFEYGTFAVQRRILVRDFYELLGPDYKLGRIEPSGVHFVDYSHDLEGPGFVNYLAAHQSMAGQLRPATCGP